VFLPFTFYFSLSVAMDHIKVIKHKLQYNYFKIVHFFAFKQKKMGERLQVPYCDVYSVSMYDHSIIIKLNNLCLIRPCITLLSLG
jgi:hypothetical protein